MKKLLAVGLTALCAAGLTGRAEPVDGFYWIAGWYHHLNTWTGQLRYWENNNVPRGRWRRLLPRYGIRQCGLRLSRDLAGP